MLLAALCFSMNFPAIELADGGQNPLGYTAAWYAGLLAGYTAFLLAKHRGTLTERRTWRQVRRLIPSQDFALATASEFGNRTLTGSGVNR